MAEFSLTTDSQDPGLETAMEAIYQWNYGSEVEELRRLYVKAAEQQWVAERDLNWDQEIDQELFQTTPLGFGIPFSRYIEKLDEVQPVAKPLKRILDATLSTGDWLEKLVGMQIVIEGLALHSFRDMRNLTEEPLLKELLTYVARDEARHHAYGIMYVSQAAPLLSPEKRESLENFALECASALCQDAALSSQHPHPIDGARGLSRPCPCPDLPGGCRREIRR